MTAIADTPPISAYIRTLNEERKVGDVIRAAFLIAREVVLIDSGSTDQTIEIAESQGARVIHQQWAGYGTQKRFAEDACVHDWLLDLDADEIVTPAFAAEVRTLFEHGEPNAAVFKTPMAIVPPGGKPWLHFGLQRRAKLYDRRKIRMPDHAFWDQFVIPAGVKTGRVRAPLEHHAVEDADQLMAKLNKYSTDGAASAKPRPRALLIFRIIFGLPFFFIQRYIFDGLFLGGVYGFIFALMTSFRRWLKDVKSYERLYLIPNASMRSSQPDNE